VNERPDNVGDADLQPPLTDELTATEPTTEQVDIDSAAPAPVNEAADSAATPKPRRSALRRKVLLVAAATTIGLLAVGGGTAASLAKHVTITVDGEQREVTTLAGSVEGALSAAGLQTGEHDVIAPAADTQISDAHRSRWSGRACSR